MSVAQAERPWVNEIEAVARGYAALEAAGFAKHVQLRHSVTRLIQSGALQPGGRLPPEQELARAIGISLGTVQKALTALANEGWIVREHGRGTFIQGSRQPIAELWHYRFIDPETGRLAPVYSRLLERRLIAEPGPWAASLGSDPAGYVEITRLILVDDRLKCWSRMHLGATRFAGLLELPVDVFDNVNLKQIFEQLFAVPTLSATQTVTARRFAASVCEILDVPARTTGIDLAITTQTHGGRPLSYQRVLIPPSDFALDVSPLRNPLEAAR
jgi:GntR family transcriptional regulator